MLEKINWLHLTGLIIDVKMDKPVLEGKLSFKMLWLSFFSKLDWGFWIVSFTKTASKKIGTLTGSIKFLSSEVALYLYKCTMWPCTECCCHFWNLDPSCCLHMLEKSEKGVLGLLVIQWLFLFNPWLNMQLASILQYLKKR